jgi:hypothetical protein
MLDEPSLLSYMLVCNHGIGLDLAQYGLPSFETSLFVSFIPVTLFIPPHCNDDE